MTEKPQNPDRELVQVAYARDMAEAGLIQGLLEDRGIPSLLQALGIDGPQLGFGVMARTPQRIMVRADRVEEARALLGETLVEDVEDSLPEPVNARYLEEAEGRKPRGYGLVGAYSRIYLLSFAILAVAFGLFLLLRG